MKFKYIVIQEHKDIKKVEIISRCNTLKVALEVVKLWKDIKPFKKYLIYNLKRGIIK